MARAIVVGAGIIGSMHAVFLQDAGYDVVHLEAGAGPTGASVRNFGLVWVSGRRNGDEVAVGQRARDLWESLAARVPGVGFRAEGSLTVALTPIEAKVMTAYASDPEAAARGTTFLEPEAVRALNPAVAGETQGALWCERDAIVEPRHALGALRAYLSSRGGYAFEPGRRVVDAAVGAVTDHLGRRWEGDVVIVAPGAQHDGVFGRLLADAPLRRVRLQMFQTAPWEKRLTTSVADGDSMRYYPAYEAVAGVLPAQDDEAARYHLQLLMVQRVDGGLTIGDTHSYEEPFAFDLDEGPSLELLSRAGRILGAELPPVVRRWEGIYSQVTDDGICFRSEVLPGTWLVTGPGGRGMTCSPAIAVDTLAAAGIR